MKKSNLLAAAAFAVALVLLFLGFLHFGEEICSITLGGHASELVDIRSASG